MTADICVQCGRQCSRGQCFSRQITLSLNRDQPGSKELAESGLMCEYASKGDVEALKLAKAKGMDVNAADYDFRTPLHIAAAFGRTDTVKWLLENGATM